MLKVPTPFVSTIAEAILHMANNTLPLYRLHVDVEEYSRSMLASAATAEQTMQETCSRATMILADLEILLGKYVGIPVVTKEMIRTQRAALAKQDEIRNATASISKRDSLINGLCGFGA